MSYSRNEKIKDMPLKEVREFYGTKFKEATKMYDDAESGTKFNRDNVLEFQERQKELKEAKESISAMQEAEAEFKSQREFAAAEAGIKRPPAHQGSEGHGNNGAEGKTLGELFTESRGYKSHQPGVSTQVEAIVAEIQGVSLKSIEELAMKTTMTTTAGFAPFSVRGPKIVDLAMQMPMVADLVPQTTIGQPSVIWMEETTFTNLADTVAEGGAKPESALVYTQRTDSVQKIATTLPVTDEQLDDVPQIRSLIDNRLTLMLKLAEEDQLLNGSGTPPDITGFLVKSGTGSTTRGASEDNTDAILRGIYDVNSITGYARASGIVMNPLNMLAIRLLRTTTGEYIWGHPADKGPMTLWGLPVVETNAMPEDEALVGDFRLYSEIFRKMGIRIDVGYINADFTNNIQRIRIEERLVLCIYRAAAFNIVDGLNQAA